ncbi:YesL family protein [Bifidobacterium lemurum]|uniref:YesL family protein n=1 Tax=Bifidobacterium lemurum TaxID=1603886 RepID=UPI0021F80999|nr:DUF624 domain-containing protein [Bifidobacterium lemurum]
MNVAMFAHTLLGAFVVGFFPSVAAAHTVYRDWLLAEDRAWKTRQVWRRFHSAWRTELKPANLFGWFQAAVGLLLLFDYRVMNWHATGVFDYALAGVLLLAIVVFVLFFDMSWVLRAHYAERGSWVVRASLAAVIARPLCSVMLAMTAFLTLWVWYNWPGVMMVFGLALPFFCTTMLVCSFARLPGVPRPQEAARSRAVSGR